MIVHRNDVVWATNFGTIYIMSKITVFAENVNLIIAWFLECVHNFN